MELQRLCTNCMLALTVNGVCPRCGAPYEAAGRKDIRALPTRYLLHGRYYLGRVLGVGGFGVTYLAYDCQRGARVAVKELFPNKDAVREQNTCCIHVLKGQEAYFNHIRKRFLEEAGILLLFQNSPDVVNVYQIFEENNTAYYAMEYLEGADLKHYMMEHGRLDWQSMSGYLRMIFRTLNLLHMNKLIHRDISPDNIFLTREGRAVLIDFGSVRCCDNKGGFTVFLKACFAPIEQYREQGLQGPWTDIYSLSVTIYYALSGVMPPKAPERLIEDSTVPLQTRCPGLPAHVAQAVTKGMAVRQEDRFQSIQDFAAALFPEENLLAEGGADWHDTAGDGSRTARSHAGGIGGRAEHGFKTDQREDAYRLAANYEQTLRYGLYCVEGCYKGKSWLFPARAAVTIGRDAECAIAYPPKYKGVSRRHCTLLMDGQRRLYVRDEQSSFGTFLNGRRLQPYTWYQMADADRISFGTEVYQVQSTGILHTDLRFCGAKS